MTRANLNDARRVAEEQLPDGLVFFSKNNNKWL
jgi:hypothetical protein